MMFHEYANQAGGIVAYGFLAEEDEQTKMMQNTYTQLFYTAGDARKALACATSEVQALICDRPSETPLPSPEVSPLNFAAALHKDNPMRDIYIERTEPQGLFVSRALAAGARGVVTAEEANLLLGAPSPRFSALAAADSLLTPPAPAKPGVPFTLPTPAAPPSDMAWLEQVLELEELDEFSCCSGPAVLEKPSLSQFDSSKFHEPLPVQFPSNQQRSEDDGMVAAFVSGRGGVGKSSLTVLTAFELWRAGSRVVMLDMDLQFGDLSVLAGNEPESRIQRLAIEQVCGNQIRIPALEEALLLLEPPQRPEAAEELVRWIPPLLAALRAQADLVLINTSCLWNEAQAVLASSVDKLVICMDQRATSVSAARQVVDLCVRLQIPSTQLCYLLNRSARNAPITDIDASLAMGGVDIMTIAEGGADVDELLSLGCPLELLSTQSALSQSIHELGAQLIAQPGAASSTKGGKR